MTKIFSTKYNYSFLTSVLNPHPDNNALRKNFTKRIFLDKSFFLKNEFFYHLSCVPHLIVFAKPFIILFSCNYTSMTKNYLKSIFQFWTSTIHTSTYEHVIQICWLKKHIFLNKNSVCKLSILFLKTILCAPIDESFQNYQTFFEENKHQWKKIPAKDDFCFLSSVHCNLIDNNVIQRSWS